jgi:hypothetical protein
MSERIEKYLSSLKEKYDKKSDASFFISPYTVKIVFARWSRIEVREVKGTHSEPMLSGDDLVKFIEENKGKIEEGLR